MAKALIAMSGGVDSSVCAYLMKERGYDCCGITMRLYDSSSFTGAFKENTCCDERDIEDAIRVTNRIGIPYQTIDYTDKFQSAIIDNFVESYEMGQTPNPCIECNRKMKFEMLLNEAISRGCDKIATGHYARVEYDSSSGRYILKKALDLNKDQSYVLYMLTQEQLSKIVFPLGEVKDKELTRQIARDNWFANSEKSDSQDICFIPDGDYASFIEKYRGKPFAEGNFVDSSGKVLGRHRGIIHYTIGQRKGLGISSSAPLYVTAIRPDTNEVVLSHGEGLFSNVLEAENINLISVPDLYTPKRIKAKIRYRHKEEDASAIQISEDKIRVTFDKPQRAITPGQAVVLYDGDIVVGGGTIC